MGREVEEGSDREVEQSAAADELSGVGNTTQQPASSNSGMAVRAAASRGGWQAKRDAVPAEPAPAEAEAAAAPELEPAAMEAVSKAAEQSSGQPLPDELKAKMEGAFGTDFGGVRVHPGSEDADQAGARAMAQGNDISFAAGQYDPASQGGQELIAHELAHVVQQRQGRVGGAQNKGGEVRSPSLEREADQAAARAVSGQDAGIGRASSAPPVPQAMQPKANEFASFVNLQVDPRSGLQPGQQGAVDRFVSMVETALLSWLEQRGTPNLRFRRHSDIAAAYHVFRKATAADRYHVLIWAEAARRLKQGLNPELVREIRMFNPTMLGDLKRMLGVEDVEPCHTYELQPLWGAGGAWGGHGVKAGVVTKRVRIRYSCQAIKGLTWTQEVSLSGIQLGIGGGLGKGKGSGSVSGPGDWDTAENQPQSQYLEPSFFNGAEFTAPSGSVDLSLGPATVKKDLGSALLISKGAQRLMWETELKPTVVDGVEAGTDSEDPLKHGDWKPEVSAGVTNEFGETSTQGDVDFEAGEWPELEGQEVKSSDVWVPLHYARIFFETGSAVMHDNDFKTVQQIVDAIVKWDKKEEYRGSHFRVEIAGSHSPSWSQYDEQLKGLDAKREDKGELSKRDLQREGDLKALKEIENYELALQRAEWVHEVLEMKLGFKKQQMTYGVMGNSKIERPATKEPDAINPYSNFDEDRSVTVLVKYQIFNPRARTNLNR